MIIVPELAIHAAATALRGCAFLPPGRDRAEQLAIVALEGALQSGHIVDRDRLDRATHGQLLAERHLQELVDAAGEFLRDSGNGARARLTDVLDHARPIHVPIEGGGEPMPAYQLRGEPAEARAPPG